MERATDKPDKNGQEFKVTFSILPSPLLYQSLSFIKKYISWSVNASGIWWCGSIYTMIYYQEKPMLAAPPFRIQTFAYIRVSSLSKIFFFLLSFYFSAKVAGPFEIPVWHGSEPQDTPVRRLPATQWRELLVNVRDRRGPNGWTMATSVIMRNSILHF